MTGRQQILNWMVASIPEFNLLLISQYVNIILTSEFHTSSSSSSSFFYVYSFFFFFFFFLHGTLDQCVPRRSGFRNLHRQVVGLTWRDGGPGSIPGQVMWDLWWTKWHSFHELLHNHDRSTGAGTIAQQWPTYQVSVSPHPEKLKKKLLDGRSARRDASIFSG
jgi:hypothetical protein